MTVHIRYFHIILVILGLSLLTISCQQSDYERMVKRELASGERHDSIFWGIHLGMTDSAFYGRCWELNKQGLVRQGVSNMTVEYQMRGELKNEAKMNFYPRFYEKRIVEMPIKFAYDGWAPWNKDLGGETLFLDVLELLERWYGEGFIKVKSQHNDSMFVKVDGNRRITLRNMDSYAEATISDLISLKEKRRMDKVEERKRERELRGK